MLKVAAILGGSPGVLGAAQHWPSFPNRASVFRTKTLLCEHFMFFSDQISFSARVSGREHRQLLSFAFIDSAASQGRFCIALHKHVSSACSETPTSLFPSFHCFPPPSHLSLNASVMANFNCQFSRICNHLERGSSGGPL